jgi:hypothetical protein
LTRGLSLLPLVGKQGTQAKTNNETLGCGVSWPESTQLRLTLMMNPVLYSI